SGPTASDGRPRAGVEYLVSLPERVIRSAAAMCGGILRETGDVVLPAALRRSRAYVAVVDSTLRYLIEEIGQVQGAYPDAGQLAENFVLRRTAGGGLETIGMLVFWASPVWVLAALADLTGAGRHLVREIAAALQKEGLLEPDRNFETFDQMLDGLERNSARVAEAINTPPLDMQGLRREWQELREEARSLRLPRARVPDLRRAWESLQREAARQGCSTWQMSSLLALSSVRSVPRALRWFSRSARLAAGRTGEVVFERLLQHYAATLREIHETGYAEFCAREMRPYVVAAARQFQRDHRTWTERKLLALLDLPRP
nr:hypothetical protein [Acidobacteriota bacterium]